MKRTAILALFPLAIACQEVEQPTTVLTQEQWNEVKKFIIEEAPTPQYPVGANFENKIELVGFDVDGPLEAGKKATFTWYWKPLADLEDNWKVFVHFDSTTKPFRQNLDHVPVGGMYPTSRWKKGQIIKDVQEVSLQANFPAGKATPYLGFFRGDTRLDVVNDVPKTGEAQPRVIAPALMVKGKAGAAEPETASKPKYQIRTIAKADLAGFTLDGKLDDDVWKRVPPAQLKPFGQATAQNTWAKTFITDDALYVGAHLTDANVWGTLKNRDDETWKQEVFEMFLDVDGDGKDYLELQVTPHNTIFDARFEARLGTGTGTRDEQIAKAKSWNLEGLQSAVHVEGTADEPGDEDQFWSLELRLPLASLPGLAGTTPKEGAQWALNFYRFDRPKEGTTWAYAWSTAPRGDFHQVDKFGEAHIGPVVDMKRPVVTPAMIEQMRRNIDLKVRPDPASIRQPRQMPKPGDIPLVNPANAQKTP